MLAVGHRRDGDRTQIPDRAALRVKIGRSYQKAATLPVFLCDPLDKFGRNLALDHFEQGTAGCKSWSTEQPGDRTLTVDVVRVDCRVEAAQSVVLAWT